jgi:hypothetical protein
MASEDLTIQQQLHRAIESGDMDGVSRILTLHPVLINIPFNGNTPLTAAVMAHKMDIVQWLVEKGVPVTRDIFELSEEVADQDGLSDEDRITAHDISAYLEEHRVVEAPLTEVDEDDDDDYEDDDEDEDEDGVRQNLDFGAEPAVVAHKLERVEVKYMDMPIAYDMLEMDEIPILDLLTTGDKIIFKVGSKYFSTDWIPLRAALEDKSSTFYECRAELDGVPYVKDVHVEMPYFRLSLMGNFTIPEQDLVAAFDSSHIVFELIPSEKKLAFVASYASVQVTPGKDGLGRQVNVVSSDHCQKGSQQVTYTVKMVTMARERGGGKKRTYRNGKKTNKRKTYRK